MFQLVYLSTATVPFTSEMLVSLLESSRAKNLRLNLTGLLLFREGCFIQVLEGDETTVRLMYDAICHDKRHHGLILALQHEIAAREFPDWAMGFHHLGAWDKNELTGYSDFMNGRSPPETCGPGKVFSRAKSLLNRFKQSR